MHPVKPDTTKLDPSAAWPFGANGTPVNEAEELKEFLDNAEEAPL
jgi:hypothetical protein